MRTKTFTKSTILSAFEKTGLISYKPEKALNSLREKLQKKSKSGTPSPTYSHTTTSTWPTPYNLPELHDYAAQMCNTLESIEASPSRCRRFDRYVTANLGRVIAGAEAEEMLRKHKKEMQEQDQEGQLLKVGVSTENEAAEIIRSRRMNEVEQARHKKQL